MSFNITSNIIGAMNTIANMQTAKLQEEQKERDIAESQIREQERAEQEKFKGESLAAIRGSGEAAVEKLEEISRNTQRLNVKKSGKSYTSSRRGFQTGEIQSGNIISPAEFAKQRLNQKISENMTNTAYFKKYQEYIKTNKPVLYYDDNNNPAFLDKKTGEEIKKPGGNK